MDKVRIRIFKSNINEYEANMEYVVQLKKCIGIGSYGYVFSINNFSYAIKLLLDPENSSVNNYTDFTEIYVVEKILENSDKININCNNYSIGYILKMEQENQVNKKINIYVNDDDENRDSIIIKKKKMYKFILREKYPILIMPLFYKYFKNNFNNLFIRNDIYLCKLIDTLINAQKELLSIGIINVDFKLNNILFDDNNNLRFIDFGINRKIENIDKDALNDIKYFIWPFGVKKLNCYLSYMICMIIIEIYYPRIYEVKTLRSVLRFVVENFEQVNTISEDIKLLIYDVFFKDLDWNNFLIRFDKIKSKYNLDIVKIPFFIN